MYLEIGGGLGSRHLRIALAARTKKHFTDRGSSDVTVSNYTVADNTEKNPDTIG